MRSDELADEKQVTNVAARQVLMILDGGQYTSANGRVVSIADAQAEAEAGTYLYLSAELEELRQGGKSDDEAGDRSGRHGSTEVRLVDATTQEAAYTLSKTNELVLLNFASARNPGGGFLGGARAQEEELCRASGLYRALCTQPEYYLVHRRERSLLYTDRLIYSPKVPFFKLSSSGGLLDEPFFPSVMTAPAPNAGAIQRNAPQDLGRLRMTLARRWRNILAVAEARRHKVVLLGAWGCGAFRNDPTMVAETAHEAIHSPRFDGQFETIVLAIPIKGRQSTRNYRAFEGVFCK